MTMALREQRDGERGLPTPRAVVAPELQSLYATLTEDDADTKQSVLVRGPYQNQWTVVAGLRGLMSQSNSPVIYVKRAGDATIADYHRDEVDALVRVARHAAPQPLVNDEIRTWIRAVVNVVGSVESVWLFGSRANGRTRAVGDPKYPSDWDLMIMGTFDRKEAATRVARCSSPNVDLFLLSRSNHEAINPWTRVGLTLFGLEWQELSDDIAEYSAAVDDEDAGGFQDLRSRAFRID